MPDVSYDHQLPYLYPENGGPPYPGLSIQLQNPTNPDFIVEIDGHVDTGAERCVFDGRMALAIELELMAGQPFTLNATSGPGVPARLHTVRLVHDVLGTFQVEAAFTLGEIRRHLLGRDFLRLVQIGFREHQAEFYVTPAP